MKKICLIIGIIWCALCLMACSVKSEASTTQSEDRQEENATEQENASTARTFDLVEQEPIDFDMVRQSELLTLIVDVEYDENGNVKHDLIGRPTSCVYWYEGLPDTNFTPGYYLTKDLFLDDESEYGVVTPRGIRKVLYDHNKEIMVRYEDLRWQLEDQVISKSEYDRKIKENAADTTLSRPVVLIKYGPNATSEGKRMIQDEMHINQISRYEISKLDKTDNLLLEHYKKEAKR